MVTLMTLPVQFSSFVLVRVGHGVSMACDDHSSEHDRRRQKDPISGERIAVGIALGVGIGIAMENVAIGIAIGIAAVAAMSFFAHGHGHGCDD